MESGYRILGATHAFTRASNRTLWERLAELHPEVDVTLVTPAIFVETNYGDREVLAATKEERGNYRVLPVKSTRRPDLWGSLPRTLRKIRPHIVHAFAEPTQWMLLQMLTVSRLTNPRALRLFHYYTNILETPDRFHRKVKQAAIFRLADGVSVGNDQAREVVQALGYQGRMWRQTPFGIDERAWTPSPPAPHRPLQIGFLGALKGVKGVDTLLQAASALQGDWHLAIGGDGPERTSLQEQAQSLGVSDRVEFHGLIPRQDAPGFMRELDVLVLPTRTLPTMAEQFGFVLVEAMLSGVAVVGSDSGAIPEVVGDAGLIFPQGDTERLTQQLQTLLDQPRLREELSRRGRKRALEKYSATALAEECHAIYSDLLRRGRSRSAS